MKRMFVAALLGVGLGLAGIAAWAQPFHGETPLEMLGAVKTQLNLNTAQQQQWDNAVALSQSAHGAIHATMTQGRAALQSELAKAEPDFASLASASDAARDQIVSAHRQARDAWLALYATFTPEQKVVARDAIKAKVQAMQARRGAHPRHSASG